MRESYIAGVVPFVVTGVVSVSIPVKDKSVVPACAYGSPYGAYAVEEYKVLPGVVASLELPK
jgi:hypothetical protein